MDIDEDLLPVYSTEALGTTAATPKTESTEPQQQQKQQQQQQQQQKQQQQQQQQPQRRQQRPHSQVSRSSSMGIGDVEQMVQSIRLRNMLLDLVLNMMSAADSSVDVE